MFDKAVPGLNGQWAVSSNAIFSFSHFDENNKGRAVFKNDFVPCGPGKSPFRGLCKKLGYQENTRSMLSPQSAQLTGEEPEFWPEFEVDIRRRYEQIFTVQVRAGLNDTIMPAPRINVEKEEFSFEWKGMLTDFFRQQLAAAQVKRLVGGVVASLGCRRARADVTQNPHESLQNEAKITLYMQSREHMAMPDERELALVPSIRLRPESARGTSANDFSKLLAQVRDWKDIVSEIDFPDSSPAERLIRKQAADRTLYLNDEGGLEVDIIPCKGVYSTAENGYVHWSRRRRENEYKRLRRYILGEGLSKRRRRVDRAKRGLVVLRSPSMEGKSAEEHLP